MPRIVDMLQEVLSAKQMIAERLRDTRVHDCCCLQSLWGLFIASLS